jgi:putative endonuclease
MRGQKQNFEDGGWTFQFTKLGWHWELRDRHNDFIGRSIASFLTERACRENALAHSKAKAPVITDEQHSPPFDESEARADLNVLRERFAMKQQAFTAGFAEGRASSLEPRGAGGSEADTWYVYILASGPGDRLLLQAASTLEPRINKARNSSAAKHPNVLVWCEWHDSKESAMNRLKEMRKWSRQRKIGFIEATNPGWNDISESFPAG